MYGYIVALLFVRNICLIPGPVKVSSPTAARQCRETWHRSTDDTARGEFSTKKTKVSSDSRISGIFLACSLQYVCSCITLASLLEQTYFIISGGRSRNVSFAVVQVLANSHCLIAYSLVLGTGLNALVSERANSIT